MLVDVDVDAIRFWPLQLPMLLGCIPGMTKRAASRGSYYPQGHFCLGFCFSGGLILA